jgi:hypothetical protein
MLSPRTAVQGLVFGVAGCYSADTVFLVNDPAGARHEVVVLWMASLFSAPPVVRYRPLTTCGAGGNRGFPA